MTLNITKNKDLAERPFFIEEVRGQDPYGKIFWCGGQDKYSSYAGYLKKIKYPKGSGTLDEPKPPFDFNGKWQKSNYDKIDPNYENKWYTNRGAYPTIYVPLYHPRVVRFFTAINSQAGTGLESRIVVDNSPLQFKTYSCRERLKAWRDNYLNICKSLNALPIDINKSRINRDGNEYWNPIMKQDLSDENETNLRSIFFNRDLLYWIKDKNIYLQYMGIDAPLGNPVSHPIFGFSGLQTEFSQKYFYETLKNDSIVQESNNDIPPQELVLLGSFAFPTEIYAGNCSTTNDEAYLFRNAGKFDVFINKDKIESYKPDYRYNNSKDDPKQFLNYYITKIRSFESFDNDAEFNLSLIRINEYISIPNLVGYSDTQFNNFLKFLSPPTNEKDFIGSNCLDIIIYCDLGVGFSHYYKIDEMIDTQPHTIMKSTSLNKKVISASGNISVLGVEQGIETDYFINPYYIYNIAANKGLYKNRINIDCKAIIDSINQFDKHKIKIFLDTEIPKTNELYNFTEYLEMPFGQSTSHWHSEIVQSPQQYEIVIGIYDDIQDIPSITNFDPDPMPEYVNSRNDSINTTTTAPRRYTNVFSSHIEKAKEFINQCVEKTKGIISFENETSYLEPPTDKIISLIKEHFNL